MCISAHRVFRHRAIAIAATAGIVAVSGLWIAAFDREWAGSGRLVLWLNTSAVLGLAIALTGFVWRKHMIFSRVQIEASAVSPQTLRGVREELTQRFLRAQIDGLVLGLGKVGLGLRSSAQAAAEGLSRATDITPGESDLMVRGLMESRIRFLYPLIDATGVEYEIDRWNQDGGSFKLMSDMVEALESQGFAIFVTDPVLNTQCRLLEGDEQLRESSFSGLSLEALEALDLGPLDLDGYGIDDPNAESLDLLWPDIASLGLQQD